VCPTTATAAFRLGDRVEDPISMYLSDRFTAPASLAGLPALAVPSGLDDDGLPLSLQILGRPFDEATVLRVGRAFEQATGFDLKPLRTSAGAGSAAEAPRG
ncbi:MAG: amidase family protein, partial [Acidobacteriota bacterium]